MPPQAGVSHECSQPPRVVYYVAASLDGFIARLDGSIDWLMPFNDVDYGYDAFLASIGTVLMGRRTFEDALRMGQGSWPYAGKRAVVFSHSLAHNQAAAAEAEARVRAGCAGTAGSEGGGGKGAELEGAVEFTAADPVEVVRGLQAAAAAAAAASSASGGESARGAIGRGICGAVATGHQAGSQYGADAGGHGAGTAAAAGDAPSPSESGTGDGGGTGVAGEGGGSGGGAGGSGADAGSGDIWLVGGGGLAGQLLLGGCLDRLVVTTVPVVLGQGLPLFGQAMQQRHAGNGARQGEGGAGQVREPRCGSSMDVRLRLESSRALSNGLVMSQYTVIR